MATRRAVAAGAARALRGSATAAPALRGCCAATRTASWAVAMPGTTTTTTTRIAAGAATAKLRWYSVKTSDPDPIPGSKQWDFDQVRTQAVDKPQDNIVLVDVREPAELQDTGKIPGAVNIPITTAIQSFHISDEDFADMYGYERPAKDQELVFYCKAGIRAKTAAGLAKHAGWENVGVYYGSWLDWERNQGQVQRVKRGEGVQN